MAEIEQIALPRVLAVLESFHTSAEIYILRPLNTLARQGHIRFDARLEKQVTPAVLAWADMVVYGRNVTTEYHPLFEEVLSRGIPTIYVLDDNFWDLPTELELDDIYRQSDQIRQLERYIRYASRVKVFSPFLAERVRTFNPAVLLDTPCMDFSLIPPEKPERDPHKVKLTYATARGARDPFLSLFATDLRDLLLKYPQQVELNLFGDSLEQFTDCGNVTYIPLNWDYSSFIQQLARSGFDIGLAPMSETAFNLSKTNTKLRDYGACRIAGVYSDVQNYADVQDGITGLIVQQQPGAWYEALERLVLEADLRSSIQDNAYQYVYEHYRQEITEAEWLHEIEALTSPRRGLWVKPEIVPDRRQLIFGNGTLPRPAWRIAPSWKYGISLVADLDRPLPFASDTLDAIYLDHQLEEVQDLQISMAEIYRICRDGANVTVVAAFARNDATTANPRLRHPITGHTARYWTAANQPAPYLPETGLAEDLSGWGLNEDGKMDFRCFQVEFFHSLDLMNLPAAGRRQARKHNWNACDTVLFNLLVVKPPCTSTGMGERMVSMQNTEPLEITLRRLRELTDTQLKELDIREATRQSSETALQQVNATNAHLERLIEAERQHHLAEMSTRQAELDQARKESEEKSSSIQELEEILVKAKSEEEALQAQLASTQAALQSQRTASQLDLQSTQQTAAQQATRYEQTIGEYQRIGRNVALQLDEQRRRLVFRVISRLRDRTQLLSHVPAGLQQLVDDSFIFNQKLDGFLLQPSISLHAVPFIPYHIRPGRSGWRGVLLAGVLDVPLVEGYLGVEIVSAKQEIVAQVTIPAIQVASYLPIRLEFAPLAESATGDFELRVFGRNLDAPLRMLEWRHYRLGGLLPTRCKPFLGLIF